MQTNRTSIHCIEHEKIKLPDEESKILLGKLRGRHVHSKESLSKQILLGMDYNLREDEFSMSHYIGTDWIDKERDLSIVVTPKIKNIDFMTMFMKCFENDEINSNFDELFHIKVGEKPIAVSSDDFQLEPILIIYFINLVALIVRSGLKKDYIYEENPLNAKIKGKIMLSPYISKHYSTSRKDIVDCKYQEYSENCLENRLLKAALICCKDMLKRNVTAMGNHIAGKVSQLMTYSFSALQNVSSEVTVADLQRVHVNPTFKIYKAAIPIAKMIIKKKGYCITQGADSTVQYCPPFVIDMALLFERYVYGLLKERYKLIEFQVATYGNYMDFGKKDEHLIIDSKYIPKWDEHVKHDNVRQLSGYARNVVLRNKLGLSENDETTILPCLVIYPKADGVDSLADFGDCLFDNEKNEDIKEYVKFKKLGIKLPVLNFTNQ